MSITDRILNPSACGFALPPQPQNAPPPTIRLNLQIA